MIKLPFTHLRTVANLGFFSFIVIVLCSGKGSNVIWEFDTAMLSNKGKHPGPNET